MTNDRVSAKLRAMSLRLLILVFLTLIPSLAFAIPTEECPAQELRVTYLGGATSATATYRIGGGSDLPLFSGVDVATLPIGETEIVSLGTTNGEELTITTDTGSIVVESDDPLRALVGRDGDSLSGLVTGKGGVLGNSLLDTLTPWLSPADSDTFDIIASQALLTYEYGGDLSFDDNIFLVTTKCFEPDEVTVRDSITEDPAYTNGGALLRMNELTNGLYYESYQAHLSRQDNEWLTELSLVVTTDTPGRDLIDVIKFGDFVFRVHDDEATFISDPKCESGMGCVERIVNYPTYYPVQFGTTTTLIKSIKEVRSTSSFGRGEDGRAQAGRALLGRTVKKYLLTFVFDNPMVIKSGGERLVSFAYRTDFVTAKRISLVEALGESGIESDTTISSNRPYRFTSDLPEVRGDGRLGVTIKTEPVAAPQEVNLRQSATGVDASCWNIQDDSCTDGRLNLPSHSNSTFTAYSLTSVKLVINQPTIITKINGVGRTGNQDYTNWNLDLYIYDSEDAFSQDPGSTTVPIHYESNVDLDNTDPPLFGGFDSGIGGAYRYLETSFPEFTLQPGTYWVALIHQNGINGLSWGHTTVDLDSDIFTDESSNQSWFSYKNDFGLIPGTAAVDIFGRPAN